MYCVYKIEDGNDQKLKFDRQISLAGSKSGIIVKLLKEKLDESSNPPLGWILPISEIYRKNNEAVIIDIKPSSKSQIELCELDTVFGFSYQGWSPIMLRVKEFYNENIEDLEIDKNNFIYPEEYQILYTMTYLNGSFKNGEIVDKWLFPNKSSTNGLLMWPESISFFFQQIKIFDPEFLTENFSIL